jgi:hypothetical protein
MNEDNFLNSAYVRETSEEYIGAINHLNDTDEDFKWRWRIIESATWKIPSMEDRHKAVELQRRVKYLQEWCRNRIDEYLEQLKWEESQEEDPYQYYQELLDVESY